ncbi:MAG: TIGR00730 family Rossman fold protein [Pseudomonadota bacterium]|nr:TIGR00730 family Rossman fold protein [Pseudomonadota bacterium]
MKNMDAIAVFCGSREGVDPAYALAARQLGAEMVARGTGLIFGGGRIGLMGIIADAVMKGGGQVTGVIPEFLDDLEVGHDGITELVKVGSMHARKHTMFTRADAFVVLPGGLGTLDECMEIITWKQLRQHSKPIVVVDVAGYWKTLTALVEGVIDGGFAHPKARDLFTTVANVDEVFAAIANAPEPDRLVLDSHL